MNYYDSSYLTIRWHEEGGFVEMEWKRLAKGDEFRQGLDMGLKLLTEKKSNKWLADLRQLGVVEKEDQIWSNENWFPRAYEAQIKYMAIVVPQSVFAKMSMNEIMRKVNNKDLTIYYHGELVEARKWLASQ
jgi:hypothetical protein